MQIYHKNTRLVLEAPSQSEADRVLRRFFQRVHDLCIEEFPQMLMEPTSDLRNGER